MSAAARGGLEGKSCNKIHIKNVYINIKQFLLGQKVNFCHQLCRQCITNESPCIYVTGKWKKELNREKGVITRIKA